MFCRTYNITANAQSIGQLIEDDLPEYLVSQVTVGGDGFRSDMIIQAPVGNANNILLGDNTHQGLFIAPGGSSGQFRSTLNNLFIRGTAPDQVIIFLTF